MALRILRQHSVRKIPVKVKAIANCYAHILYDELGDDVSGMLVPLNEELGGKKWAIVVHSRHAPVRKRFTIAHELGHLLLHEYSAPHADRGFNLRLRKSVRFRDTRSSEGSVLEEIEANQFAAELLMPEPLVLHELSRQPIEYTPQEGGADETLLRELAHRFRVSQQALAIRISSLVA